MSVEARGPAVPAKPDASGGTASLLIEARAVLFDIEGTLVDAVPLTLQCWTETLGEFGYSVGVDRLQPLSGMDGRDMLDHVVPGLDDEVAQRILKRQGERYRSHYLDQVRSFPGVAELFTLLRGAGKSIGLATDSSRDELDRYVEIAGIAGLVDARACGNEVKRGKPHPDVMHLALEKLDASPGDAIMIGDTPFDAMAARKVEVRALGLLTGGFSEADLIKAGAETVLPDVGALLEMVRPLLQPGGRKAS
jgi:phosphoglycolate phosphatase-like HAD superfamily hydrolase